MEDRAHEQGADLTGNTPVSTLLGAESGAVRPESGSFDADLEDVVRAWPGLTADVKASILAMVTAAGDGADG